MSLPDLTLVGAIGWWYRYASVRPVLEVVYYSMVAMIWLQTGPDPASARGCHALALAFLSYF